MEDEIILGVDPGTSIMGFSIIKVTHNKPEIVVVSTIKMAKMSNQNAKLQQILESSNRLISTYHPTVLSIEAPFYGKNPQSMLKLGRAQGVVIAACLHQGLTVFEYSPRKIKQSITGKGNSSKEQVAAMLKSMYSFTLDSHYLDATDALAVAVCHYLQNKIVFGKEKFSGWESFISKNSDRIIQ